MYFWILVVKCLISFGGLMWHSRFKPHRRHVPMGYSAELLNGSRKWATDAAVGFLRLVNGNCDIISWWVYENYSHFPRAENCLKAANPRQHSLSQ